MTTADSAAQDNNARSGVPAWEAIYQGWVSVWCTGREDADVRMLGGGRPYVLEIINARAAMPPQSYFDDAQRQLNEVTCRWRPAQIAF